MTVTHEFNKVAFYDFNKMSQNLAMTTQNWLQQVQSPNDRLMDRQSAWLNILANARVNVSVCQIVESKQGAAAKKSPKGKKGSKSRSADTQDESREETNTGAAHPSPPSL